jgi:hypothetical protein
MYGILVLGGQATWLLKYYSKTKGLYFHPKMNFVEDIQLLSEKVDNASSYHYISIHY